MFSASPLIFEELILGSYKYFYTWRVFIDNETVIFILSMGSKDHTVQRFYIPCTEHISTINYINHLGTAEIQRQNGNHCIKHVYAYYVTLSHLRSKESTWIHICHVSLVYFHTKKCYSV